MSMKFCIRYTLAWGAFIAHLCLGGNTISTENSLNGVDNWLHEQQNPLEKLEIDGFTTKISYFPGDIVHFKTSAQPWAHSFKIEIYRLGYYKGLGARLVSTMRFTKNPEVLTSGQKDTFEIIDQPACLFDEESRLTDCSNWHTTAQWSIPVNAVSGVYVALPIHEEPRTYYGSYIPFVIRKRQKVGGKQDMLFKTADTTWVAYNRYGDYNLYRGTSFAWSKPDTRADKASYNRPFSNRMAQPMGYEINFVFGAEYPMIYWLEKHGYDVSYCASQDVETMHQDGTLLNYKTILSVGHDEYWTGGMKAAHEHARDHGVHLAFFSGNEAFWRVVWEEDTLKSKQLTGGGVNSAVIIDSATKEKVALEPKRVFVCRKESHDMVSPATPEDWTGTFRDPRFRPAEPESLLTGQNFMVNGIRDDAMTVTAEDAELRFWRNTTFAPSRPGQHSSVDWTDPDKIHQDRVVYRSSDSLLGYEWDTFPTRGWRHPGLIPLSTTHVELTNFLVENYGTSFEGSGTATHRLSLYRHYNYASDKHGRYHGKYTDKIVCFANAFMHTHYPHLTSTSLVFGAGTIQWSWALSEKRDGSKIAPDRDIQQATLNLFADMGVFPGSFVADMTPPLVFPKISTDVYPPSSKIAGAHQKEIIHHGDGVKEVLIEVRGLAKDDERSGGRVAAVEVSADGGKTWVMAAGRRHWHHTFNLNYEEAEILPANFSSVLLADEAATRWLRGSILDKNGARCHGENAKRCSVLVLSRAIDDSGWHEEVDALSALCGLLHKPAEHKNILGRDGISHLQNARIVDITF